MSSARPRWTERTERGTGVALRLAIRTVRLFGNRASRLMIHPVAAYFLLTGATGRRASRAYFERLVSLPEGRAALGHAPDWRDSYRQVVEFATSIYDRLCVWSGLDDGFEMQHRGAGHFAHLPDAQGEGSNALGKCGALIVSAHLGSFDMMRAICMEAEVPVSVVMYGANAETINSFLAGLNPDLDLDLIHVRAGDLSASFEIRRAVERGSFVVIMGDRTGADRGASHRTRFLGAPVNFPTGPFQLAAMIGCPLMVATATREGPACYRVDSQPLYPGGRVPRSERSKVVQEMVEGYAAYLERAVLRAPHQWFNFFDFWAQESAER